MSNQQGDRLIDLEAPHFESTFPVENVPAATNAASNQFVPTPYLDIMSVGSKIHAHSKEASSYHRLFVEPLAIPDLSHTGIKTSLVDDGTEVQRITYPNGKKRMNLEDLLRVELRGAVYNSTAEFRQEDLEDKPGTATMSATGFTSHNRKGRLGRGPQSLGSRTAPAGHIRGLKTRKLGSLRSTGAGRRTAGPRTLQRLTIPETSPFWRQAPKHAEVKRRDQQVQNLLRNLRSFGHERDVRK